MKQVIGFTEKYYTLWMVNESETDGFYVKNLSMDLNIAKSKVEGEYEVDLERRGTTWDYGGGGMDMPEPATDEFSFGMCRNFKIMDSDEIWQLERAAKSETTPERQELAAKRLMELDSKYDLVPFRDGYWDRKERDEILTTEAEEQRVANLERGHFFNHKDKVTLELKELEAFSFSGDYGGCYVRIYESIDGRIFKYLGGSPTNAINGNSFCRVSATIKHSEYRGEQETKLLRIKAINKQTGRK